MTRQHPYLTAIHALATFGEMEDGAKPRGSGTPSVGPSNSVWRMHERGLAEEQRTVPRRTPHHIPARTTPFLARPHHSHHGSLGTGRDRSREDESAAEWAAALLSHAEIPVAVAVRTRSESPVDGGTD